MYNYYTFLFKTDPNEGWCNEIQFLARSEEDAWLQACDYADKHGYIDFTIM